MKNRWWIACAGMVLLSACGWVKLTPLAESVQVRNESEVMTCSKVGTTTASVADKVAGLKRQDHIVQDNLRILARNAAADMGGDTIAPASPITDGKQIFGVYKCGPR